MISAILYIIWLSPVTIAALLSIEYMVRASNDTQAKSVLRIIIFKDKIVKNKDIISVLFVSLIPIVGLVHMVRIIKIILKNIWDHSSWLNKNFYDCSGDE